MASALRQEYVNKRSLYLQILPNAFVNSKRAEIFQTSFAQFDGESAVESLQYRTFLLDISLPLEELRKKLDKKWRNQLNAAERNNLEVLELEGSDAYKKFSALYAQMWERKKFETSVNVDEFGRIQQQLPASQRMKIFICRHESQEVAGLVCSAIGDTGIYLLGASNEAAMKLKASYVLQWAVIQHLKNTGIHYYDLGGINPLGNPGVYHFKSGLSGVDMAHMNSLIACENGFSSAFAKTGHAVQRNLRRLQHAFAKA
jgi:lipid II:glycine glycyltransferase (peptidoglycan interpeptide bridge formation enzyme)